jgi:hypothetical protein
VGLSGLSPRKVTEVLRGGGVKEILKKPVYPGPDSEEPEYSQAEVIADVINVMRLDNKELGAAVGVDLKADEITEDRVAEMLANSVEGDPTDLVGVFNELEVQRDKVLRELLTEDRYELFVEYKQREITTCNASENTEEGPS